MYGLHAGLGFRCFLAAKAGKRVNAGSGLCCWLLNKESDILFLRIVMLLYYICICMCVCVYIYIHREREREGERERQRDTLRAPNTEQLVV